VPLERAIRISEPRVQLFV